MNPRKRPRRQTHSSRAADRKIDDIDPRDQSQRGLTSRKAHRKTLQLCAQIADTLNGLLAECHNEALQMLQVASVEPAPGASQLLVTVCPAVQPTAPLHSLEVLQQLSDVAGWLRCEVAAAITRKRAPKLLFQVAASWFGERDMR